METTPPSQKPFPLIGYLNPPTFITLGGLILASLGVYFAAHQNIPYAAICLIYAGICDLFDGYVARKCNLPPEQQDFGIHIDTVADMASFGVAPAFIVMHAGLDGPVEMAAILVYICCAGTRLAYFNSIATKTTGPVAFFTGLPVTYAAMIFPLVLYFCYSPTSGEVSPLPLHITLWVVAFLFVLRVPLPKPRGILYVIFPVLALAITGLWLKQV